MSFQDPFEKVPDDVDLWGRWADFSSAELATLMTCLHFVTDSPAAPPTAVALREQIVRKLQERARDDALDESRGDGTDPHQP